MKLRPAAALALVSTGAFAALIIAGATWAVLVLNAVLLLVPRWLANFRDFPWNPSGILGAFQRSRVRFPDDALGCALHVGLVDSRRCVA